MLVSPGCLSRLNPCGSTQCFDVFEPFDCLYSLTNIDTWLGGFNLLKHWNRGSVNGVKGEVVYPILS